MLAKLALQGVKTDIRIALHEKLGHYQQLILIVQIKSTLPHQTFDSFITKKSNRRKSA